MRAPIAALVCLASCTVARTLSLKRENGATDSPCGFYDYFVNHTSGPGIHKWLSYFPVYEEHFGRFCNPSLGKKMRMMEWGVQSGGSMMMWREAFGQNLELLVGADINPATKSWEKLGSNIKVRIGSQADHANLQALKKEFSSGFDIILDDGSHVPNHIFTTFVSMWQLVRPGGVYLIEDLHGRNPIFDWLLHGHQDGNLSWSGIVYPGLGDGDFGHSMADNIPKELDDSLNTWKGVTEQKLNSTASNVQKTIESVKIYPYMLAITKRKGPVKMRADKHGTQWIPR